MREEVNQTQGNAGAFACRSAFSPSVHSPFTKYKHVDPEPVDPWRRKSKRTVLISS